MKVELQQICKSFGKVVACDRISLTIEAGTIHALLGENGAGKSTLVKILSGFITGDSGNILLDGNSVSINTTAEAIRAGIGMLHQDPLDFPALSVLDNFMIGGKGSFFLNHRIALRRFQQLCSQFSFNLSSTEIVENLTVGERQQVELLRLISLGVQTLVLDEPTTGISAGQKDILFRALQQMAAQGKSVVLVSHKLEDVEALCDRITVIKQGKVVGHVDVPIEPQPDFSAQLVEMMFGQELSIPLKHQEFQLGIALRLQGIAIASNHLDLEVKELEVRRGEVIGLAGLDGSGQSLLLKLCAGLLQAKMGSIQIGDTDMTFRAYGSYRKAGVGFLPADRLRDGLVNGLSVQEHITLQMPSPGWLINWNDTLKATQTAIAKFNIRGKPSTKVERLSGGNQQRTQIALLPERLNLLLMEHPTRGLDMESTAWIWEQLAERTKSGTTILFASSDLDEIMQQSDRILVFSSGKVSAPLDPKTLTIEQLGQAIGGNF